MNPSPCLKLLLFSTVIWWLLPSCTSYKNISYFKNVAATPEMYRVGENVPLTTYASLKIQPDDILKITITTLDPDFNGVSNININNTVASLPASMSGVSVSGDKYIDGFLVNKEGEIDIPVLGTINVNGLTLEEAKTKISQKASDFYVRPNVNVRLANFRVTVIGEVARPGTYIVNEEQVSILDALGLSGDLTIYGKRDNVMLIRQDGGTQKKIVRMNLNDAAMMSSPYFYLRQGDVIYVEPGKGKAAATDLAATKTYAIAGSALAVLITLISRVNF